MSLTLKGSIGKMSDRELLELIISNQMYLNYRMSKIETHILDYDGTSGEDATMDALDKSKTFFRYINEVLIKLDD